MSASQTKSKPNFLRLVDSVTTAAPISHDTFVRREWQSTLFASENPSLLLFVNFEEVDEVDFTAILTGARPKFLFDLRRVPRFDIGKLNRKQAFALFAKTKIKYLDLSRHISRNGEPTVFDVALVARIVVEASNQTFIEGPAAFLVDAQHFDEKSISELIEALPSERVSPWDVLQVPNPAKALSEVPARNIVFISHANPEDNAFVTWLAGQLTLAGYSVWSDVTQLVGGEVFWDDIEVTIRQRAAKVIAVLSSAAQRKPGVLDELDLAIRVERFSGLNRFVLPLRLDDLSYSDVRANLARKNVIDFRESWAAGLHSVLAVLERDRVPRITEGNSSALARWVTDRISQSSSLVQASEKLTSNWLPIIGLPEHVFLHDVSVPAEQIASIFQSIKTPTFRYLRLVGSFATAGDLQNEVSPSIKITSEYRIALEKFLEGKSAELPGLLRWEARKVVTNLLRQAWNLQMERQGLRSFEMASRQLAWYFPKGLLENERVEFTDDEGRRRRKSLLGWSDRRQVFWHFAVEAKPVLTEVPYYVLRQHVIFTQDGVTPIESKEKMHLLRRRFCRSWWNDRWRDLLVAYVIWIGRKTGGSLPTGTGSNIRLDEKLMALMSPFSIAEGVSATIDSTDSEDELDSDDEGDSFDPFYDNAPDDNPGGASP